MPDVDDDPSNSVIALFDHGVYDRNVPIRDCRAGMLPVVGGATTSGTGEFDVADEIASLIRTELHRHASGP